MARPWRFNSTLDTQGPSTSSTPQDKELCQLSSPQARGLIAFSGGCSYPARELCPSYAETGLRGFANRTRSTPMAETIEIVRLDAAGNVVETLVDHVPAGWSAARTELGTLRLHTRCRSAPSGRRVALMLEVDRVERAMGMLS